MSTPSLPNPADNVALEGTELPAPELRKIVISGTLIVGVFFLGLLGWAGTAPLQSAAVAPGILVVEGNRKTVQHLEGGIVGDILVRDGDSVEAGQVVVILNNIKALATLELLKGRHMVTRALIARLIAERDGSQAILFPKDLLARAEEEKVDEILRGQEAILAARREAITGQAAILEQRSAGYSEEIGGIEGQIRAEDRQLHLIAEEEAPLKKLLDKGLALKPRLLQLQRRAAEIEGDRSMHVAQIARARQKIAETLLRISELRISLTTEVVEKIRIARSDLYDLEERLRAAENVLARTKIKAPIGGKVVSLQVHTTGGVISPGATLMEIVPMDERLVVEAQVDPKDIDVVHEGMTAQVRLTAFNMRSTAAVDAVVTFVSADHLTDERTYRNYYLAKITLDPGFRENLGGAELHPGMQAEVLIITGEQTALAYMIEPLTRSFNRAFRED